MIDQAREGIRAQIAVNRSVIKIARARQTDDGFEGKTEDPSRPYVFHKISCRISHESRGPTPMQSSPSGFTINLSRYILVAHSVDIRMGDIFDWHGQGYEIGPVDPLYFGGQIIGYQAPLKESANAYEITRCG